MAAFTLVANANIDSFSGKTGGDTYALSGYTLTIDQDSRVGLNQSTSASIGSITVSATLGGTCRIDGRKVRMIPYNSGTGNVPAWNTTISRGSASGLLIGVHSSLTAASTATGAAMPASGYIRIKQWNDVAFTTGALTGISASATAADSPGWLEIVGDEAGTITANRLGTVEILGEWFQVGTTNGTSNQTMQIPNNGTLRYAAGVYIETAVGAGTYAFWPNAGTVTTTGTEATRGKVVWIDANGLVRIGNSGAATNGYTPVTGLKVMIGNVFLENCTTAARTANVIPNSTVATRFDFTTTGGGVVTMSKVNSAWYLSFAQAYSVSLTDVGAVDAILVQELATPLSWTRVGVGNKPTTALSTSPLTMTLCFAGGTFTDCVWNRVTHASSGHWTLTLTDIEGFTFTRDTMRCSTIRANATTGAALITRAVNCTWTDPQILQGQMSFVTCTSCSVSNPTYVDAISGTTQTTASYVYQCATNCNGMTFTGLTLPVTNTHPYTAILLISAAGCANIKLRSIGTRASPLSLGSSNATGLIYSLASGAAATDIKIQRVYCSNTRTGTMTGDNSSARLTQENVFGDYADNADVAAVLNFKIKGYGGTPAMTAQTNPVYGTHWFDCFTSTTAGRIGILMNEPNALTATQVTLTGGAAFTAAGGLYMPTVGQTATFITPDWVIGHTSFQNSALVMAGGTATNYTYRYKIDKGSGWSAWSASGTATQLGTALSGETSINAQTGFKLELEITTGTGNTAAITSVYVLTNSTTTAQDYQYALENPTFSVTGLQAGSEVRLFKTADMSLLGGVESSGTSESFTYPWDANVSAYLVVLALGYQNIRLPVTLTSAGLSVPIQQVIDRQYLNP